MLLIWGTREYGTVDRCGETYVATRFFHVWYLPLAPMQSRLVLETLPSGETRSLDLPLHGRSVLAGYLRAHALLAAALLGVAALGASETVDATLRLGMIPGAALALAVAAWAWGVLGRLPAQILAQRQAYGQWCGFPVDPAVLGAGTQELASRLRSELERAAIEQGALGYRGGGMPDEPLLEAVARMPSADARTLSAALTLARIDRTHDATAEPARAARFDALHAELWSRLQRVAAGEGGGGKVVSGVSGSRMQDARTPPIGP